MTDWQNTHYGWRRRTVKKAIAKIVVNSVTAYLAGVLYSWGTEHGMKVTPERLRKLAKERVGKTLAGDLFARPKAGVHEHDQ